MEQPCNILSSLRRSQLLASKEGRKTAARRGASLRVNYEDAAPWKTASCQISGLVGRDCRCNIPLEDVVMKWRGVSVIQLRSTWPMVLYCPSQTAMQIFSLLPLNKNQHSSILAWKESYHIIGLGKERRTCLRYLKYTHVIYYNKIYKKRNTRGKINRSITPKNIIYRVFLRA